MLLCGARAGLASMLLAVAVPDLIEAGCHVDL